MRAKCSTFGLINQPQLFYQRNLFKLWVPFSVPSGLQCSNYWTEILAICTAAEHLLENGKQMGNIAIFTDSLSTLQALDSADPHQMTQQIHTRWLSRSTPDDSADPHQMTKGLPAFLSCQADSSIFSVPPVGACSFGTDTVSDRKWNSRQTCKNWQLGSADTEPCHHKRGQDSSPLSL